MRSNACPWRRCISTPRRVTWQEPAWNVAAATGGPSLDPVSEVEGLGAAWEVKAMPPQWDNALTSKSRIPAVPMFHASERTRNTPKAYSGRYTTRPTRYSQAPHWDSEP